MKVIISGRGQYIILSITKIVAERMKEYALFHCLNRSMCHMIRLLPKLIYYVMCMNSNGNNMTYIFPLLKFAEFKREN